MRWIGVTPEAPGEGLGRLNEGFASGQPEADYCGEVANSKSRTS